MSVSKSRLHATWAAAMIVTAGAWRSLVAHYTGGVGVVGSNPAAPTKFFHKNHIYGNKQNSGHIYKMPILEQFLEQIFLHIVQFEIASRQCRARVASTFD